MSLKVIAALWIGLLLIIGGLLFNAYSKLKPETFIALLTEQVQKNYPGSKLNVGKIDYRFSLDFNLNLQNIHLRRSGKLLGSIGEVELKVPWWLLLMNRGNAQINLKKLDIYIDHAENHDLPEKIVKQSANLIKVSLPAYLSDAKFTLRAKEVSVRDIHNARRYFMVSKLLVREFQYGKNSAFELNIPISIKHNSIQYASELWLFGDVTPEPAQWRLNYRGEFRTKESSDKFQIEDIVINGEAAFTPSTLGINSVLNLLIDKEPIGKGQLKASQEELIINMQFTKLPLNYFSLVYEEIKNPYLKQLEGDASGIIKFEKNFDTSKAAVEGKIAFDGDLSISEKVIIPGKWQISFLDAKWEISFMSPKGEASFFRRSVVDMNKNTVTQYNEELGFTGLEIPQVIAAVAPLSKFITDTPSSYFATSISYNKCLQGDKVVDGNFQYGVTPDQRFYRADMNIESSSLKMNYSDKSNQKALDLIFSKFSFSPDYQILSPYFTALEGSLDGKVEGRWSTNWESGQWLFQVTGDGINQIQGKIPEFISKTAEFYKLDSNLSKKQALNIAVKNNILTLNSLMLDTPESAKITGSLSSKQKSVLTLTYPKNKKFKALKKEVIEPYWMQKEEI
jgi:hypothetical protein